MKTMRGLLSGVAVIGIMALFCQTASADTYDFSSQINDSYLKSGSNLKAEDNPFRDAIFSVSNSVTTSFSPNSAFQFVDNTGSSGPFATNMSGTVLQNADADPNSILTVTFKQKVTSVSLDFAAVSFATGTTPTNTFKLTSNTGLMDTQAGVFNSTSGDFEGALTFSNAAGFSSISLQRTGSNTDYFALDNLKVTPSAVPVPEFGTWAGLTLGVGFAGSLLRRRRRVLTD